MHATMLNARLADQDQGMNQMSFASLEYAGKKRKTRREKFLSEMQKVVPWSALIELITLIELIEPHHASSGSVGRSPIGVARMLRMDFLRKCPVNPS